MKFLMSANGFFVTYANGATEELAEKDFRNMARRQMMTVARHA